MRLLDRYLLREFLVPLGYCLCGFLIFWITFDFFDGLRKLQEMEAGDIALYYALRTPGFLVVVLPISLLLAVLYALTNHARHYELTAIRAAGVSLWRLCLPHLTIGFLASLALFVLNEITIPACDDEARRILGERSERQKGAEERNQVRNFGFVNAAEGRRWQIAVYNAETAEMIDPIVTYTQAAGAGFLLYAKRALHTNQVWTFYDVRVYRGLTQTNTFPVPVLRTNVLAMPQFSETPGEIRSKIKVSERLSKRGTRGDLSLAEILDYLRLDPTPERATRYSLYTKLHGRIAAPWTCLVVVVIAIPFGAASGRRNVFIGVASSLVICFAYFIVQQITFAFGMSGHLPGWLAAWFPNLAFGIAGAWMTARVR